MAVAGAILLMARYRAIGPKFAEDWEEVYRPSNRMDSIAEAGNPETEIEKTVEEKKALRARKTSAGGIATPGPKSRLGGAGRHGAGNPTKAPTRAKKS
jgi:hypothetical protein